MKNWCEEFFDDFFADHHLVRNDGKELADTLSFFTRKLHLRPGFKIFDQCCGVGNLSIALAGAGYVAYGMDLIPSYIARARGEAQSAGVACHFDIGDAHEYVTPERCDAAINWWTSFGYTPDDKQNIKMLQRVSESLKSGAWFALDYMNAPQRLAAFGGKDISRSRLDKDNYTIIWESRLDRPNNMIVKTWHYKDASGKKIEKQGGGAKLYTRDKLEEMFTACGFDNIAFYGSVGGEDLTDSSPRCITVARKS